MMTHPRDHILPLAAQLRSDMTTLANVTCKVRVNGGSATTYTNSSSPAITQNSDITYGYDLQIPASTYTDGDVIEATWLYSDTPYAYSTETIGPAAIDGAHYTNGRGDNLANLDATISSRSTVAAIWAAAVDSSGVTTLLTRIASALTITGGKVDINDKTSFALTSAYDPAKTAAQAGDAMALTTGERTTLAASIWGALTSGLTTVGSVGKLLATNINATIDSRLAAADYTAPDNTSIAAIEAKTNLFGAGIVVYGGPVLTAERVEIVQGDDYLAIDGRALDWQSDDFPDLTGATITLDIRQTLKPNTTESYPATVLSATEAQVELTSTETADLAIGTWSFALKAVLANTHEATLVEGILVVKLAPS